MECLYRNIIVEITVSDKDTLENLAEIYQMPYEKLLRANHGKQYIDPSCIPKACSTASRTVVYSARI